MARSESPDPQPLEPGLYTFSFTCPYGLEETAGQLLNERFRIMLAPDEVEAIQIVIGEKEIIQGTRLIGFCSHRQVDEIIKTLAGENIAGYSRASMVRLDKFEEVPIKPHENS